MPPNLMALISLLPVAISIGLVSGGYLAFRRGYAKQSNEIEGRVIDALKALAEAQETQIKTLEKKVQRLEGVLFTIQTTLKKRRGLLIEVNDDMITLTDQTGQEHTVQIRTTGQLEKAEKDEH